MDKKFCYLILESITNDDGEFIPVIIKEGEKGYYPTDWTWGKDYALAKGCARSINKELGLTEDEVNELIAYSMRVDKKQPDELVNIIQDMIDNEQLIIFHEKSSTLFGSEELDVSLNGNAVQIFIHRDD